MSAWRVEYEKQVRKQMADGIKCFAATHLRHQGGAFLVDEKIN